MVDDWLYWCGLVMDGILMEMGFVDDWFLEMGKNVFWILDIGG